MFLCFLSQVTLESPRTLGNHTAHLYKNNQNCTLCVPEGLFCLNGEHRLMNACLNVLMADTSHSLYIHSLECPHRKEVVEAIVCLYGDRPECDITSDNLNKLYVNTAVCYCKSKRERHLCKSNIETLHDLALIDAKCAKKFGCAPDGPSWESAIDTEGVHLGFLLTKGL